MFVELLNMQALRMMPRSVQVQELQRGTPLGVAVFRNFVAHYHCYADFYVALCTTLDGVDFTLVFKEGRPYMEMRDAIGLSKLPKGVKGHSRAQLSKARDEEDMAQFLARGVHPLAEDRSAERIVLEQQYGMALQLDEGMAYYRSLTMEEQALLLPRENLLGMGQHEHYVCNYYRMHEFYAATCITRTYVPFSLAFQAGCLAHEHMRSTVGREKQR